MGSSSKRARRKQSTFIGPDVPAELAEQFAKFRRTHALGTRVPDKLRAAVCHALEQGVGREALRRALGLGGNQLDTWQRRPAVSKGAARIFEVEGAAGPIEQGGTLELRVGDFAIVIRSTRGS